MLPGVNKRAISQAFGRAADHYDQHAVLQRYAGERLKLLLGYKPGKYVLDAGCGSGWFSRCWQERGHSVVALDFSEKMLRQAHAGSVADHYLTGDLEALPLASGCIDLCWSNLAVQWCNVLSVALREMYRVTRYGGQILFSTLTERSLHEVVTAWRGVDAYPHVNRFLSVGAIQAACQDMNFRLQEETVTLFFPDALSALRSLKGSGATHLHQGRRKQVLTRQRLQQLTAAWPHDERGYPLSYQLILGVIVK